MRGDGQVGGRGHERDHGQRLGQLRGDGGEPQGQWDDDEGAEADRAGPLKVRRPGLQLEVIAQRDATQGRDRRHRPEAPRLIALRKQDRQCRTGRDSTDHGQRAHAEEVHAAGLRLPLHEARQPVIRQGDARRRGELPDGVRRLVGGERRGAQRSRDDQAVAAGQRHPGHQGERQG